MIQGPGLLPHLNNDPDTWIGKDMRLVTEWLSTREMAKIASRVSGKNVVPLELDDAAFEATKDADYPAAEEIYLIFCSLLG